MESSATSPESFVNRDGVRIHERRWSSQGTPRAVIAVIHGFAEHSGRYQKHATRFTQMGIAVESFDHAGHGRSGGRRGYIADFRTLVRDALDFLPRLSQRHPDTPVFLFGHSLGGAVAALVAADQDVPLRGLVMSSPAIALMEPLWLQKTALMLSRVVPRVAVKPLNRRYLCTDRQVTAAYTEDPLTFRRPVAIRTAAEIIRLGEATLHSAQKIRLPLLVVHGTADRITSPQASAEFYQLAASRDKSLSLFRDMYHETFNEPQGGHVLDAIADFVEERW